MKTLVQKSTGKYVILPLNGKLSHFSDIPEIWGDDYVHTLETIIPDIAKNLKIELSDIEILDVSVVENHPYNEEILQKLRAIKENTIPNFEKTVPQSYAMFQLEISHKWDEVFHLLKIKQIE